MDVEFVFLPIIFIRCSFLLFHTINFTVISDLLIASDDFIEYVKLVNKAVCEACKQGCM